MAKKPDPLIDFRLKPARERAKGAHLADLQVGVMPAPRAVLEHGVTIEWLADVFGFPVQEVRKAVRGLTPVKRTDHARFYDLAEASFRLLKLRLNYQELFRQLKPADLPPTLQAHFWTAMKRRFEVETEARRLWQAEDIVAMLVEVFSRIRATVLLWPDAVERETGLSPEQREELNRHVDALLTDLVMQMENIETERYPFTSQLPSLMSEVEQETERRLRKEVAVDDDEEAGEPEELL